MILAPAAAAFLGSLLGASWAARRSLWRQFPTLAPDPKEARRGP